LWRQEIRGTLRNLTLGARREPTTNSTHMWHWAGIEPRAYCREASALSTVPSLLLALYINSFPTEDTTGKVPDDIS